VLKKHQKERKRLWFSNVFEYVALVLLPHCRVGCSLQWGKSLHRFGRMKALYQYKTQITNRKDMQQSLAEKYQQSIILSISICAEK
jgi:hypothetical protein